jgi:hypothetical protein
MQTGVADKGDLLDSEQETELQEDPPQGEEHEEDGEASEAEENGDEGSGEEDETVVSIGEEEPPTSEASEGESTVFADLRKRYRELSRKAQQLEAQLQQGQPHQPQAPTLRAKPSLEGHEYDAEKYEADLEKWYAEKREAERQQEAHEAARRQVVEAQQKAVQAVQEKYVASRSALKVRDFQEAEDEVVANLSEWQRGIAVKAKQPAELVYALGKNPKKLAELASIKDPVEFAFAVADLRREVKVTTRKATNKPAPETTVRGGSSGATPKATLERLEAEADRTGDRSKVIAYKRQQRLAGKS